MACHMQPSEQPFLHSESRKDRMAGSNMRKYQSIRACSAEGRYARSAPAPPVAAAAAAAAARPSIPQAAIWSDASPADVGPAALAAVAACPSAALPAPPPCCRRVNVRARATDSYARGHHLGGRPPHLCLGVVTHVARPTPSSAGRLRPRLRMHGRCGPHTPPCRPRSRARSASPDHRRRSSPVPRPRRVPSADSRRDGGARPRTRRVREGRRRAGARRRSPESICSCQCMRRGYSS
eukprot:363289-Chlamydomonas_euryale.AAC.1